jgi:cholesterol oxidase
MASFDPDVIVIGSGFGGSVAALRAVEKGYSVAVLEAGKRWRDQDLPKTSWDVAKFAWQPEFELLGIQRVRYLDDVIVLSGAGVGGGSLVYANTLYYPHDKFFQASTWSYITDWKAETAPYYDLAQRMLGVMPSPYMDTDGDRIVKSVARDMQRPYVRAPLGIYFGTPGVEVEDPYFGGEGPSRTGCISCGACMIGCPHNAKNKLTANYLYLAEQRGAVIRELNYVDSLKPLEGGGYEVHARHPGLGGHVRRKADRFRYTAEHVVVSAHAYGTAHLLLEMQHEGHLDKLADTAGKVARTNSEALISVQRAEGDFKKHPEQHHFMPGTSAVTAAIQADEESTMGPVYYNVGSDAMALLYTAQTDDPGEHPFHAWLKELVRHPGKTLSIDNGRHWSERGFNMLCMRDHDDWLDLYWDGRLRSKPGSEGAPPAILEVANEVAARVAEKMGGRPAQTWFAVADRATSSHFIGGMIMGDTPDQGPIDPYQRVFGHPGLHVMDGSVIPANPGVNPSLSIVALAERAMSFWPNKGDGDTRPPLGSGYEQIAPVMPRTPVVPSGAPAEYRLDATEVSDLTITWDPRQEN